jgi:hypothetical protein
MGSDRELLELAAKAAGYHSWDFDAGQQGNMMNVYTVDGSHAIWWPLEDDGDALRLAVKLGMVLSAHGNEFYATAEHGTRGYLATFKVIDGAACDAMRRAITSAAAKIGRAMK